MEEQLISETLLTKLHRQKLPTDHQVLSVEEDRKAHLLLQKDVLIFSRLERRLVARSLASAQTLFLRALRNIS
jgi:hypothetical protein